MKVIKIVTHDGADFFCETEDELRTFIKNYRERGKILAEEKGSQFLVDHLENIEMEKEEYYNLPISGYFVRK